MNGQFETDLRGQLLLAAVAAGLTTFGLVYVMDLMTPPCGGPFCFYALLWLPVSAVGAAAVALVVAWYARRGGSGYAGALIAAVPGFAVAWYLLIGRNPF